MYSCTSHFEVTNIFCYLILYSRAYSLFRCTSKCVRLAFLLELCSYGSGLFSLTLQRDFSFLLLWNWKEILLAVFSVVCWFGVFKKWTYTVLSQLNYITHCLIIIWNGFFLSLCRRFYKIIYEKLKINKSSLRFSNRNGSFLHFKKNGFWNGIITTSLSSCLCICLGISVCVTSVK